MLCCLQAQVQGPRSSCEALALGAAPCKIAEVTRVTRWCQHSQSQRLPQRSKGQPLTLA